MCFDRTIVIAEVELEPAGFAYLRLAVDADLLLATGATTWVYFEIGALMRAIIFTLE